MKYLCIIILLIILPVSLFPDRDNTSSRKAGYGLDNFVQNSRIIIPINYEISNKGFVSVSIENLYGQISFSANLGIKANGNYSFYLPIQKDQQPGFYKLKFFVDGKGNNERFIYLPSSDSVLI